MKPTEITSIKLLSKNRNININHAKDFAKADFWYYTSLSTANLILENYCFYASNYAEMNDKNEAELHGSQSEFLHGLCFCNSNTEKIPMWYLYAGILGRGASIGLTPLTMIRLIESINVIKVPDTEIELKKDVDFKLEYGWIFYRKDKRIVNYRNHWYRIDNIKDFEVNNHFIKDYPWEYEREFRIVIHNLTEKSYPKLQIDVPDEIVKSLKVKLAPEQYDKSILDGLDGFKNLGKEVLQSNLAIKMSLCKRNKGDILEYIQDSLKKKEPTVTSSELCELVCGAGLCDRSKEA